MSVSEATSDAAYDEFSSRSEDEYDKKFEKERLEELRLNMELSRLSESSYLDFVQSLDRQIKREVSLHPRRFESYEDEETAPQLETIKKSLPISDAKAFSRDDDSLKRMGSEVDYSMQKIENYLGDLEAIANSKCSEAGVLQSKLDDLIKFADRISSYQSRVDTLIGVASAVQSHTQSQYETSRWGKASVLVNGSRSISDNSIIAKIRVVGEANQIAAMKIFDLYGGYALYPEDDVFGVIDTRQIKKLRKRRIPFEILVD